MIRKILIAIGSTVLAAGFVGLEWYIVQVCSEKAYESPEFARNMQIFLFMAFVFMVAFILYHVFTSKD